MISIRVSLYALLVAATLPPSFAGCTHQQTGQQELSQIHVRQLAAKYRDEWLNKNPFDEAAILARGTIKSVERMPNGWHVVFVTETGHSPSTPEGIHDYYLHVYLKQSGDLDRVVRGPDTVS